MSAFLYKFTNMKKQIVSIAISMVATLAVGVAKAQFKSIIDSTEVKIEQLLKRMTLAEKIGQMNQYNGFWEVTGPVPKDGDAKVKYDHLRKGLVGAVLNVRGVENVRKLQAIAVNETRLKIPLLFGYDVIHGHKTIFPIPLAESCSWDLEAIEKAARVAAIEASALGINWTFAPMVDICRDPRWGRVMEGAGEDPYLGTQIGLARVKGFQGHNLAAPNTIAACAKHFAGYGFSEAGRDYNTVDISHVTLHNIVLPPFKALANAGVATFMNAFNVVDGVPATGNSYLQRNILKQKWNYKGMVVSDWGSIGEMVPHGFAANLKEAAHLAVNAGSDMDMEATAYITYLEALVKEGKVKESTINDAVRRILRLKFRLGLFDDPYRYCDEQREKTMLYHPDHIAAALDVATKSIVLLKNEKQLLPLAPTQKNILVIGALAADKSSPLGSWRIGSDDDIAVSVLEGLSKHTNNYTYVKGADVALGKSDFLHEVKTNTTDTSGFATAVEAAKKAEVVIMVLGEQGFQSGEARSSSSLQLPGVQQQLLEAVYRVNKNIVLVLMNGRPLAITWAQEHIPAIVEAWQPGIQSGNAIANIIFGKSSPSGRLTISFPRNEGQIPVYYNHYSTGRPDAKDVVFWSHYSDIPNTPLYPFGYGLTYTTFKYSNYSVTKINDKVLVKITITNTGQRDGEEVVQLYIRDKVASIVRPVKELKGFKKLTIAAGKSAEVSFELTKTDLSFYNANGDLIFEPGAFDIMVGPNAAEVSTQTIVF